VTILATVGVWVVRVLFLAGAFGDADADRADFVQALLAIAHIAGTVGATLGLFSIEVRRMQAALTRAAASDPLTGLPNRRATAERFHSELARAVRHDRGFALLVVDVDHFKQVNDDHGHLTGDALLEHVAKRVGTAKRGEDLLGRVGGDEFVLLMIDPATDHAAEAARRICAQVANAPLLHGGLQLDATLSGGLALFPGDGNTWDALFATADARLYEAKRSGRNRVVGPAAAELASGGRPR
jgi:diguanylate cyclase (GGDEF)-like protein